MSSFLLVGISVSVIAIGLAIYYFTTSNHASPKSPDTGNTVTSSDDSSSEMSVNDIRDVEKGIVAKIDDDLGMTGKIEATGMIHCVESEYNSHDNIEMSITAFPEIQQYRKAFLDLGVLISNSQKMVAVLKQQKDEEAAKEKAKQAQTEADRDKQIKESNDRQKTQTDQDNAKQANLDQQMASDQKDSERKLALQQASGARQQVLSINEQLTKKSSVIEASCKRGGHIIADYVQRWVVNSSDNGKRQQLVTIKSLVHDKQLTLHDSIKNYSDSLSRLSDFIDKLKSSDQVSVSKGNSTVIQSGDLDLPNAVTAEYSVPLDGDDNPLIYTFNGKEYHLQDIRK